MSDIVLARLVAPPKSRVATLDVGHCVRCNTEPLRRFACAEPDRLIRDIARTVAAVEFADRRFARGRDWRRQLSLTIPVSDPDRWNAAKVKSLHCEVLDFLTGDQWDLKFVSETRRESLSNDRYLPLKGLADEVMAFSNGLDSLAVGQLSRASARGRLLRVRIQRGGSNQNRSGLSYEVVPYCVRMGRIRESSGRSRAYKYTMLALVGAHMAEARKLLLSESGQTALGPSLAGIDLSVPYRGAHPKFAKLMEAFISALCETRIQIDIPRLWSTKGDAVRDLLLADKDALWRQTKSCWKGNRHSSALGKWHPCGVCAGCMLRRASLHAAGLQEPNGTYGCDDLGAPTLEGSLIRGYKYSQALAKDAKAAVFSMDHLAALASSVWKTRLRSHAAELSRLLPLDTEVVRLRLERLVQRHATEWQAFLNSLHPDSFVRGWVSSN